MKSDSNLKITNINGKRFPSLQETIDRWFNGNWFLGMNLNNEGVVYI